MSQFPSSQAFEKDKEATKILQRNGQKIDFNKRLFD